MADRRDFLKTIGLAGVSSAIAATGVASISGCGSGSEQDAAPAQAADSKEVPLRDFGKTGVKVSSLSLGGMFDIPNNQLMLKKAIEWGVTYWDTADCYVAGKSEQGIGQYFQKYPEVRKNIFLVTKSDNRDPDGMTSLLNRSLQRMKTDYIDLYFIHGVSSIDELNDETKAWAEQAKKDKKIKFFGFSTHKNMEDCMIAASKLGWIDGLMITYNYRIMNSDKMKEAVEHCVKAGIGLTAMKTQAEGPRGNTGDEDAKLLDQFLKKGFTDKQAKLLAVWENQNIAAICSQMPNLTILMANVAAALNKPKLSQIDKETLEQYAKETRSCYCAGCANICESTLGNKVPISDIMRYLMYHNSYQDRDQGKQLFFALPTEIRKNLLNFDYSIAEHCCPQKMPIASLIQEATEIFA